MFIAHNRRQPDICFIIFSFFVDPEDYQPPIWKSYCKYLMCFLTLYMYWSSWQTSDYTAKTARITCTRLKKYKNLGFKQNIVASWECGLAQRKWTGVILEYFLLKVSLASNHYLKFFQLILLCNRSHCAVFLEQAPSLSFWWTLSRAHGLFWASLTKTWHRCQMPSCFMWGKIWVARPDSVCARTAAANCCSLWWAAFNEVIKRRSRPCRAEVSPHICRCFWAGIDYFTSAALFTLI